MLQQARHRKVPSDRVTERKRTDSLTFALKIFKDVGGFVNVTVEVAARATAAKAGGRFDLIQGQRHQTKARQKTNKQRSPSLQTRLRSAARARRCRCSDTGARQ